MRIFVVLLLCLIPATFCQGGVRGNVDGVEYDDETQFADALGVFGVDLIEDTDRAHGKKSPKKFGIRGLDIKRNKRLQNGALGYMLQFGFLEMAAEKTEEQLLDADTIMNERTVKKALRKFQKFYNLGVTGEVDEETRIFMSKERCGAKDVEYEAPNRAKRYTLSRRRWNKHTLTYWFDPQKYTLDLAEPVIRSEVGKAMAIWAGAADVTFQEVAEAEDADLKISWEFGDHGDGYPFYGPGGTLAHAFYPVKGLVHFDDAEGFTANSVSGINLKYVATHELGHSLGIKHSDATLKEAIMYALYKGYSDDLQLHADDVAAVEASMGEGQGSVIPAGSDVIVTVPPPTTEPAPAAPECIIKIDAAWYLEGDPWTGYLFAGAHYYRLKAKNYDRGNHMPVYDADTGPRLLSEGFPGIPRNLDCIVNYPSDTNAFLAFKGDHWFVWSLNGGQVTEEGALSDLWPENTPTKIVAGFQVDAYKVQYLAENSDRLYYYDVLEAEYGVEAAGSNNHDNYPGGVPDDVGNFFYRGWVWGFQGSWYSIAKAKNGALNSVYSYRPIKNDIKLPMCPEETAGSLSNKQKKNCKKELKKMRKRPGFLPSPECREYIAERYTDEVEFDYQDF